MSLFFAEGPGGRDSTLKRSYGLPEFVEQLRGGVG